MVKLLRIRFGNSGAVDAAMKRLVEAAEWARNAKATPPLKVTDTPGGPVFSLDAPPSLYITLSGAPGADGGYPYSVVTPLPAMRVTAPGSGYLTTAPTAAVTGGGGTGAAVVALIAGGAVVGLKLTARGSGYVTKPTLTLTGGDGTGATAEFTDQWETAFSSTAVNDLAYEGRGVRELPADGSVYPAARCPQTGQLLFFCRSKMVARTTTVTTYPTAAGKFYAVVPIGLSGTPGEGNAGGFTTYGGTFFAFNLGGAVPPPGTYVVTSWVGSRWVFRYG